MTFLKSYKSEIVGVLICLILGTISGYGVRAGNLEWYNNLIKPNFTPPAWVFAPVWTLLYILEGILLGMVWHIRERAKKMLLLFLAQFLLSLSWPFLFFYCQSIELGLANLMGVWVIQTLFLILAWKYKSIFLLFLPYALWVSFALVLNFTILLLNFV